MPNICFCFGLLFFWLRFGYRHLQNIVFERRIVHFGRLQAWYCLGVLMVYASRWTSSSPISDSRRGHLAGFPVVSVMLNIHRSPSWSVQIRNQNPLRHGLSIRTAYTILRHSLPGLSMPVQPCLVIESSTPPASLVLWAGSVRRCTQIAYHKRGCQRVSFIWSWEW